jgi:hypothetical protein
VFYNDVHHKRLMRVIPSITDVIIEFFDRVTPCHLGMASLNVKVDGFAEIAESKDCDLTRDQFKAFLQKAEWASMLKWCKSAENTYLGDAEMILEENFVFKDVKRGKEWLGYCLTQLLEIQQIHMGHIFTSMAASAKANNEKEYNPYD